jgi:hypothetical protein
MPRPSLNGHRIHVIIPTADLDKLTKLSNSLDCSISDLIRQSITDFIALRKETPRGKPRF